MKFMLIIIIVALCVSQIWTISAVDVHWIVALQMWIWRKVEQISENEMNG